MLLEFKISNYKSFKDETVFTMKPASSVRSLAYSVIREKISNKEQRALCSAVIYGPNASGKTNIIGAMDTFKSIILRGNLRNSPDKGNPNAAAGSLELIPNSTLHDAEPVNFGIQFISDGMIFEYELSADLGKFLDSTYPRRVIAEILTINGSTIFKRGTTLEFGDLSIIQSSLVNAFEENAESARILALNNLNQEELFLTSGFKTMFSSKIASQIVDWLTKKLTVIYRADALSLNLIQEANHSIFVETTLNKAAACFGINSNALGYVSESDTKEADLCSIFKDGQRTTVMPAEVFESYGTVRFMNIFPLVLRALLTGGTLAVDEFDASIHPMALMSIINIFHNDEVNINHAQLIFNTHNPIFLNANLYRRDEIKFVERDESSHFSSHYSLSDFDFSGRKNQDYMQNYFVNRYGAIKDIDFTDIIKTLLETRDEG